MSGGSRGIVGRIWEKICDLFTNSEAVKDQVDQFEFVDGKLRTTGEDGGGGSGDLQDVIDELIELNSKVSLEDTLDLVNDGVVQIEVNTAGTLSELQLINYLLQVDSVGNTTYIGYAAPGTTTSSSTWAIKRVIETGGDASLSWADGDRSFDNTWDNRLILTYS